MLQPNSPFTINFDRFHAIKLLGKIFFTLDLMKV
jgi:hypothetical protein